MSRNFKVFLKKAGIRHELTVPKIPEQNSVAERVNRTLMKITPLTLYSARTGFLVEALSTTGCIRNTYTASAIADMTPCEAPTEDKTEVSYFKTHACPFYAHIHVMSGRNSTHKVENVCVSPMITV